MHTYIHPSIHWCMHACMHTYTHIHTFIQSFIHSFIHTYIQTDIIYICSIYIVCCVLWYLRICLGHDKTAFDVWCQQPAELAEPPCPLFCTSLFVLTDIEFKDVCAHSLSVHCGITNFARTFRDAPASNPQRCHTGTQSQAWDVEFPACKPWELGCLWYPILEPWSTLTGNPIKSHAPSRWKCRSTPRVPEGLMFGGEGFTATEPWNHS